MGHILISLAVSLMVGNSAYNVGNFPVLGLSIIWVVFNGQRRKINLWETLAFFGSMAYMDASGQLPLFGGVLLLALWFVLNKNSK